MSYSTVKAASLVLLPFVAAALVIIALHWHAGGFHPDDESDPALPVENMG